MSRVARRRLLAIGAAVSGLLMVLPAPSGAADEVILTLPVSGVRRGSEGTSVLIASANVPLALVGQSCEIFGSTVNQRSVHLGNDLLIVNGDESFTITNFEDEGDIVHNAGDVETLAATIQLSIRFGPDAASSGGFEVTVRNCVEATPQTTVHETTVPETTVPQETTTESTQPAPAPTVPSGPVVEAAVPTTAVPTTAVPTTAVPTTAVPTTAVPVATTPLGPTATDALPVTGSETAWVVGFGAVIAAVGLVLRFVAARTATVE